MTSQAILNSISGRSADCIYALLLTFPRRFLALSEGFIGKNWSSTSFVLGNASKF